MDLCTLAIALLAILLIYSLPIRFSLIIYCAVLLVYPDYLRVIIAGLTLSAARIVVVFLLIRCISNQEIRRRFQFTTVDLIVISAEVIYLVTLMMGSHNSMAGAKYRAGMIMDTSLAYFAARMLIGNINDFNLFLKQICYLLIPLAILGFSEALTRRSLYDGLLSQRFYADRHLGVEKFQAAGVEDKGHAGEKRLGLYRAQGSHAHPILFGISFVLFIPYIGKSTFKKKYKRWKYVILFLLSLGCFSSLSSGPFIALGVALMGMLIEVKRKHAITLFVAFICLCIFLEIITDRPHFYHVFASKLAIDEETAYARTRLFDAAIDHFDEYWMYGYGLSDPGWGQYVSGTNYTDVCVYYIYLMTSHGIFGLLIYVVFSWSLVSHLWKNYDHFNDAYVRSLNWAAIVCLFAIFAAHLSVTPFGSLNPLYYISYGIAGSIVSKNMYAQFQKRTSRVSVSKD